jgi:protein phosphatase
LLKIRSPLKVFGNLHGNLADLNAFFKTYGFPFDGSNGDIDRMNYLFLGDYIGRGPHSVNLNIFHIFIFNI